MLLLYGGPGNCGNMSNINDNPHAILYVIQVNFTSVKYILGIIDNEVVLIFCCVNVSAPVVPAKVGFVEPSQLTPGLRCDFTLKQPHSH